MKIRIVVLLAALLLTAACQPIQPEAVPGTVPAPVADPATLIRFTSGEECRWAGEGATLAFDGQRANYTCTLDGADSGVLLGEIAAADPDSTFVTLTHGVVAQGDEGFTLESSEEATYMIARVILLESSGEGELECLNAGQGATFGFEEVGRANYTCGDYNVGPFGALFGPLVQGETGQWSATFGLVSRTDDGFALDSSEELRVTILTLEPAE